MLLLLSSLATSWAAPTSQLADQPFTARPFGYLIPSFSPIPHGADQPTADDGFMLEARLGAEAKLDLGGGGLMGSLIEVDLSPSPVLKDAFAFYRPAPFLRFDLGQFKVPYSIDFLASDTRRLLPATPLITRDMVGRDVGFMMTVSLPVKGVTLARAQVAAFNGEGPNQLQDVDQHYLYAVRATITPFGARNKPFEGSDGSLYLGLGGGWLNNRVDEGAQRINEFGGDLQFAWNVLSIQGEFLYGTHAFDAGGDYHEIGGYGTLSAFIPLPWVKDHVQLVGRFGQSEPNDQVVGSNAGSASTATREYTVGLNLYWFPSPGPFNDVKLQAAWSHFDELEGSRTPNDRFVTAASVRF